MIDPPSDPVHENINIGQLSPPLDDNLVQNRFPGRSSCSWWRPAMEEVSTFRLLKQRWITYKFAAPQKCRVKLHECFSMSVLSENMYTLSDGRKKRDWLCQSKAQAVKSRNYLDDVPSLKREQHGAMGAVCCRWGRCSQGGR